MKNFRRVGLQLLAAFAISSSAFATDCNSLRVTHCGLPFPNDEFAVEDESSPTGLRLDFSEFEVSPEAIGEWGDRMQPMAVMNGRTGFSALAPIYFEITQDIDPLTLPLDGAQAVMVFDLNTGKRIGINAEQSPLTDSEYVTVRKPVLQIYPRSRFAFGHKHLAIVTDRLSYVDGKTPVATEGVEKALSADGDPRYRDIREFLREKGIATDSVRAFTAFTVNDEESATRPLIKLVDRVYSTSHGIRDLRIERRKNGPISLVLKGRLKTTDFRFPEGDVDWSGNTTHEDWISFILYLPAQAQYTSVPLMVYGHGIVAFKETAEILRVAPSLAERGIATIAINHPLHGDRGSITRKGTSIFNIQEPQYIPDLIGMASQSPFDFHSLLAATREAISHFDPFIYADGTRIATPFPGDREVLDMSKLFFTGTSMGGVFGASFASTAPFRAIFFQVAGAGIGQAFTHTIFFDDLLYFNKMFPGPATDIAVASALLHHAVDPADGLNHLHMLREPFGDLLERPMFLQYGVRDEVVVPQEPWAVIETLNLPLVGEEMVPMPFPVNTQDGYGDGWGFVQTDTKLSDLSSNDRLGGLGDLATHLTFIQSAGLVPYLAWADHLITPLVPVVDSDGDGVEDYLDNCPLAANADQADDDGDGLGNACDATNNVDIDGDGILNAADNCPNVANADQADVDNDGIGDACDAVNSTDTDSDGVYDVEDNCPAAVNPDQADSDHDGIGDLCDDDSNVVDSDKDKDGIADTVDNCPSVNNPDQADTNTNGIGNACESQRETPAANPTAGESSGGGGTYGILLLLILPVLIYRRARTGVHSGVQKLTGVIGSNM